MSAPTLDLVSIVLPIIDHHLNEVALSCIVPPAMPPALRKYSLDRLRRMQRELSEERMSSTGDEPAGGAL